MTALSTRFGRTIRRLREDAGFSQEDFAARAKIARVYMGSLERGKANPSIAIAEKVAVALGMTLGQLMTEVDRTK